jgi:site-specific DNA-methyltransferase (cytosine-N4-specific)
MKPYIQPFEERLALAELRSLTRQAPTRLTGSPERRLCFSVAAPLPASQLAQRLAYWECVTGKESAYTTQVLREATVNVVRNGLPTDEIARLLPFNGTVPLPNRRCLRYGTHGIHEYRGKFFPQLVKALVNIADVPRKGGVVADPMCGSGTTLVEGVLAGHSCLGLDMNPLSTFMSKTKCALLRVDPRELSRAYELVRKSLLSPELAGRKQDLRYLQSLPRADQAYLRKWFSGQVLLDLDTVAQRISAVAEGPIRDFMWIAMSNILRRVSWQKEDDLRVRKEVRTDVEIDPIKEFLEELGRSVRTVLAFLYQNEGAVAGSHVVQEGDARRIAEVWPKHLGKCDAVITSPPYATALPYLDTDRLSLIYLRLLSRARHREHDLGMIGNREVTNGWRKAYWTRFAQEKKSLPKAVVALIERIDKLNADADVGFRRRNLPALLAKYFFDMREVLAGVAQLLKPGRPAYVVVGNNHTVAGGIRVEIQTAELLSEIADSVGLRPREHVPMEMLQSRDIFKRNAVASETVLFLERKPQK